MKKLIVLLMILVFAASIVSCLDSNGQNGSPDANGGYDNHTFTTVTVPPTCVDKGYDEKTCSVCGFLRR